MKFSLYNLLHKQFSRKIQHYHCTINTSLLIVLSEGKFKNWPPKLAMPVFTSTQFVRRKIFLLEPGRNFKIL